MIYARKLRNLRLIRQLTQEQLARKVECHVTMISHMETGRQRISPRMADRLERFFYQRKGALGSVPYDREVTLKNDLFVELNSNRGLTKDQRMALLETLMEITMEATRNKQLPHIIYPPRTTS